MKSTIIKKNLYERHPVLWDPRHYYYYSKKKKLDAWEAIAQSMNLDVKLVRQKMVSLLGSFRAQKSKGKKSVGTGANKRDVYISKWFAFKRMHFLLDKDEPKNNSHTETGNSDLTNESGPSSPLSDEYYHEPTTIIETHDDSHVMLLDNDQSNLTVDETDDLLGKEMRDPVSKRSRKMKLSQDDRRVEQSFDALQDMYSPARAQFMPLQDRFSTYGEHVANKLRTYSTRTQAIVEHAINNILFEADMGNYEKFEADDPMIYNHFLKCPVVSSSTASSCHKSEPS
ncbi:uncharacterized protein LOC116844848 isoform X2 [Odontomachus brunneus]|uniref:uncharacterized protein LOC116844848 isoform X2 n=1 Tax=Odontomachus brunneus TaxID=486640 RepID=UPI0013F225E7|nr:uncharacterized protein LOC116844848 isoform X2 [Odontomachus brunneus]